MFECVHVMSTLEKIQIETCKLDTDKQQQVSAYVELIAVHDQTAVVSSGDDDEREWAVFENHAAEASI